MKVELRGITKRFGSFSANDAVDLVLEPGQIHALLGENGAGKSTLMNVLYGLYQPDTGEILLNGTARKLTGPGDAIAAGIGMVHQHFMLIPVFTVAENVMLGREEVSGPLGRLSRRAAAATVREMSERYGLATDPEALVEELPVGAQQRVEILKALARNVELLILDEPTALLTPREIDDLIAIMDRLRNAGTAIVFITHKLREVKAVAEQITVMRHGHVVGHSTPDVPEEHLAAMMVGRAVDLAVPKSAASPGAVALRLDRLCVRDDRARRAVDDVSLTVRCGEILALAGVQGNGQEELVEAIVGLRPVENGEIRLYDQTVTGHGPDAMIRAGVGFVPEDRHRDGMVGSLSVAENLIIDRTGDPAFSRGPQLRRAHVREYAAALIAEFDIRPADPDAPASTLSGGNQQKMVLARELSRSLRLLMVSQPTRGVDVGAQAFIHQRIVAERDRGTPVVLVSTELDEVLALADRIAVMYRGRVIGELPAGASPDEVGLMMAGIPRSQAHVEAELHPSALTLADAVQPQAVQPQTEQPQ